MFMKARVVGVSSDSSVRCHLVWYDERSLGLGGQPDGGVGGVTDGDNQGGDCGSEVTYSGEIFYMYLFP